MPLNYANAYRNFLAQARKAEVDPETVDFSALYDPTLSSHEMKRVIKEVVGTPGEYPEPVLGVPQRVWDQVSKRNERCTVRLTRCLKQIRNRGDNQNMPRKKKTLTQKRAGKNCPHGFRKGSVKCRKRARRRS